MIRLQRILLPTDFSELSAHSVSYATALAERFEAELHVLHVVEEPAVAVPEYGGIAVWQEYLQTARRMATEKLATLPDPQWSATHPVVRQIRQGTAFVEIIRYAREREIDLIVMSTHGRTGLKHVLMGSVAERVVRQSPCPVLTVRPSGHQFVLP